MKFIFQMYLTISLTCFTLFLIHTAVAGLHMGKMTDPFKLMKEINELLDELPDGIRRFFINLINASMENRIHILIFEFFLSIVPILNIILVFSNIKGILEEFDEE